MASEPLITKYRPHTWDELIGHETATNALRRALLSAAVPHAFLFTGPSGIGKTTIARILGADLQAEVTEVDAASHSGVDAMRDLVEFSQHSSFTESGRRLLTIDECHALSRAAWQAILKLLEEPPLHCFLALCTTELAKVPETIRTRAFHIALRPVSMDDIGDLLAAVTATEGWEVKEEILTLILAAANGSPRQALSLLDVIHDAPSAAEARRIISITDASNPMAELLQLLIQGKHSWKRIRELMQKLEGEDFDEAAIGAGRYMMGALLQADDEKRAQRIWQMIEALVFPAETYDRKLAFVAAVGRIMWGGE